METVFTSRILIDKPYANGDYFLLFKNGVVNDNFSISGFYVSNKELLDYTLANNSHLYKATFGDYYGYIYCDGGYHYMSLNNNVSYVAFASRTYGSAYYVSSYQYYNAGFNDYNALINSRSEFYNLNSSNAYSYEDYRNIVITGNTNPNIFSSIFDYRLAVDSSTYYLRGEDYYNYTSLFQIDNEYNNIINLAFGYDNSSNAEFDRGYSSGFSNGRVGGYDDGYRNGKADGISIGKVSQGSYGDTFDLIGGAFNALTSVSSIEILPNVTLGTCISIPLIISLIVALFKIVRG